MKHFDVLFIHPPRTLQPDYGKNSKFVRGEFIFIPMGIFAMADNLEKGGFGVQIINYPLEQYLDRTWSLLEYLKTIDFDVCAIDLHWIHNAHGAIGVARIVKEVNPNAKVIFGGFSASYYHKQILENYKAIDGVIRGDGEVPLLRYIQQLKKNGPLNSIPNLSYRSSSRLIKANPLSYSADSLDDLNFTNVALLKNAQQYFECSRRMMGISFNLPVGRGCPFNCPLCAGGQRAQRNISGREKVILRNPEKVVEDISYISGKYKISSVFFGHGTYASSLKYWKTLFELIQKENLDIGGDLEIWRLPFPKDMWKSFYKTFPRRHSSISISPRTLSSRVQQKIARICDPTFQFPKNKILDLIKNANLYRMTLRIWLTMGYPFQTRLDVFRDFNFAMNCVLKYGTSKIQPITIMSEPYHIFPGSPAHESPKAFGVELKYNSFLQIADAFRQSKNSFFYNVINYKTNNFSSSSILNVNKLFFLSTVPMLLTTGRKIPDNHKK
ncbi:MAG: cobalamin-dependent protein [Promethearchaeota archaeon]